MSYVRDGEKVFIYGNEVNDFGTVDYDALSILNVSATQELVKRVAALGQQNDRLQTETKRLTAVESENAELKAENAKLAAEMETLKKVVGAIQEKESGGVRKVVLSQ